MGSKSSQTAQVFFAAALDSFAERTTMIIAMIGGVLMMPTLFWYLSGLIRYGIAVPGLVISVAVACALAAWLLLNYAVQPTRYSFDDKELMIQRRWARRMRIPLKTISAVSAADALGRVPGIGLRRSFNAGVFGYQGPFELDPYGRVFFIATNRERLVAIAREGKPPLIISPARPRDFVDSLREQLLTRASEQNAD